MTRSTRSCSSVTSCSGHITIIICRRDFECSLNVGPNNCIPSYTVAYAYATCSALPIFQIKCSRTQKSFMMSNCRPASCVHRRALLKAERSTLQSTDSATHVCTGDKSTYKRQHKSHQPYRKACAATSACAVVTCQQRLEEANVQPGLQCQREWTC